MQTKTENIRNEINQKLRFLSSKERSLNTLWQNKIISQEEYNVRLEKLSKLRVHLISLENFIHSKKDYAHNALSIKLPKKESLSKKDISICNNFLKRAISEKKNLNNDLNNLKTWLHTSSTLKKSVFRLSKLKKVLNKLAHENQTTNQKLEIEIEFFEGVFPVFLTRLLKISKCSNSESIEKVFNKIVDKQKEANLFVRDIELAKKKIRDLETEISSLKSTSAADNEPTKHPPKDTKLDIDKEYEQSLIKASSAKAYVRKLFGQGGKNHVS